MNMPINKLKEIIEELERRGMIKITTGAKTKPGNPPKIYIAKELV